MLFLIILLAGVALAWLLPVPGRRPRRDVGRVAMALAFVVAGIAHLLMPTPFVQHLPTWVPARHALIYLTGLLEIVGGVGLIGPRRWQRPVALLAALYLVAVLPANVYVAVADVSVDGQPGGWYAWLRLPLQALFIGWVLWSTPKLRDVQHADERRPERAMAPVGR